jgi:HD-like signal output (HDOD) protein
MSLQPSDFLDDIPSRYHAQFRHHAEIPILREVIQRLHLLLIADDLTVNIAKITELVRHDAVLTNLLLRLSHSVVAGQSTDDVEHAIRMIGIGRLRDFVIAIGLMAACEKLHSSFSLWTYWVSAATRANFSNYVSRHIPGVQENEAFILCLTQGIGRLVIGHLLPDVQERILRDARKKGDSYHHAALSHQLNDATIGGRLLRSWSLSPTIITSVECQYDAIEMMTPLVAVGQIVNTIIDNMPLMRLPGDFDESDISRLRKLLSHAHATNFEISQWKLERTISHTRACALIDCIRH